MEFGISSFRGTYLLPPALKQFHASYPQIQVEITELDSWDLEDRILKGLLDIALIAAPSEKLPPALKQFHASYPQIQVEITELDSWDLEDRILKGLLDIALIAAPSEKIRHSCDFLMKDEIVLAVEITELDSWDLEDRILKGLLDIALIAAPSEKIRHSCDFLMKDEIVLAASVNHPVMAFAHPCREKSGEYWIDLKDTKEFTYILGSPLMKDEIVLAASVNHPVMAFAHPCREKSGEYWIDLKDTKEFTYILGSPGTVLGTMLRRELLKAGVEPAAASSQVSAPMAAAMARAGLGLAATYRSCIPAHEPAQYLKIGRNGVFLDLALLYPSGGYRSKAAAALGEVLRQTYLGLDKNIISITGKPSKI